MALRGFIMESRKSKGAGVKESLQFAKNHRCIQFAKFVFQKFFNTSTDTKVHRLKSVSAVCWDAHCINSIAFQWFVNRLCGLAFKEVKKNQGMKCGRKIKPFISI